jgi:ribosomal protein S18 acetylase RimI-like enzyme
MMTIRHARPEDLDALAFMGAELARFHHEQDPTRFLYAVDFERGYHRWFGQELPRREVCFFVAEAPDGRVMGYVYGRLEGRDWNSLLEAHVALVDLFVMPEARRGGAGEALVRAFCGWAEAQKTPQVVLSTMPRNTAAQALFARLGFRPTMIEMTRDPGATAAPAP